MFNQQTKAVNFLTIISRFTIMKSNEFKGLIEYVRLNINF